MNLLGGGLYAVLSLFLTISNVPSATQTDVAEELTAQAVIECSDGVSALLTDGKEATYTKISDGGTVTIRSEKEISSLYVMFDRIYGPWTLSDGEKEVVCGQNDFLHEYVDVRELFGYSPKSLTLMFSGHDCTLSELHIFSDGEMPAWVQKWQPPCQEADLMLVSTHMDDEQLYFAGILPYYAGERGLAVQVVYFTDPFSYHDRPHEKLNGLWTVGVRNYPVASTFADLYSTSAAKAYAQQKERGVEREDIVQFQVEMIRRFHPHVIVGHDIDGEYGHGQHIINCQTLMEALELAADETYDPDSALANGVWNTPKTYIHLWKENPIVMDWDTPLEHFNGMTAFQVSQEGFLCHVSQQGVRFTSWMFGSNGEITRAADIRTYSPCLYGLYRTEVGYDSVGGDMFENIPQSYAEIKAEEIQLQEELQRQEELRLQEEQRRQEELLTKTESESSEDNAAESVSPGGSVVEKEYPGKNEDEEEKSTNGGNITGIIIIFAAMILTVFILSLSLNGHCRKRKNSRRM